MKIEHLIRRSSKRKGAQLCAPTVVLLLLALSLTGCDWKLKPTYPANQIAGRLQKMLATDYRVAVETRHVGQTLQTFMWRVGLMKSGETDLSQEAATSLERAMLCATRVALSTDATLDFIEVKMADMLTGTTVTLWRYVPDIKDSMLQRIGDEEYYNRIVMEVSNEKDILLKADGPLWNPPLTMKEFLGKQVVFRVKRHPELGLQMHEDVSNSTTLVMVVDNWDDLEEQGKAKTEAASIWIQKTIQTVLKGYRFKGFSGVELHNGRGIPLKSWTL